MFFIFLSINFNKFSQFLGNVMFLARFNRMGEWCHSISKNSQVRYGRGTFPNFRRFLILKAPLSIVCLLYVCRDTGNLRRHVKLLHGVRKKAVRCPRPWCEMEFTILADMVKHKEECLKICTSCNKTFNRFDKYSAHLRAHNIMNQRMND